MALENFVLRSAKVPTLGRIPGNRMKQMSFERVSSTVIATRTKRSRGKKCQYSRRQGGNFCFQFFFVLLCQQTQYWRIYVARLCDDFKWHIFKWTVNQLLIKDIWSKIPNRTCSLFQIMSWKSGKLIPWVFKQFYQRIDITIIFTIIMRWFAKSEFSQWIYLHHSSSIFIYNK